MTECHFSMTLEQKKAQINVLKAELCIEYMKMRLNPPTEIADTIIKAMYVTGIVLNIHSLMSTPAYPKGIAIVGNSDKKEVIIKPN